MNSFHLEIVTPDGSFFNGDAELLVLRTISGEVGIEAGHTNYLNALGMGEARVTVGGRVRRAACIGGMVTVLDGNVSVVATTFEWAEMIDKERAAMAEEHARELLRKSDLTKAEQQLAESKLKRALVRRSVAL